MESYKGNFDAMFKNSPSVVAFSFEQDSISRQHCSDTSACNVDSSKSYKSIDFVDFIPDKSFALAIRIQVGSKKVRHTLTPIDRCCKLQGRKVRYDGVDDFKRYAIFVPENRGGKVNGKTRVFLFIASPRAVLH